MKCKGCGVEIQNTSPNEKGYSPKEDSLYCERCYRLTHYGKLSYSFKDDVSVKNLFSKINNIEALIVWIVDLFDLESAFQEDIVSYLRNRDVLIICTKRDLLPDTIGSEKLGNYLLKRLKKINLSVKGVVVIGDHGFDGKEEVLNSIELLRKNRDLLFIGNTNAGKSTLLNNIFDLKDLTVSKYPGTTIDINKIAYQDYFIYDTPGFNMINSLQILASDEDMEYIIPKNKIKPIIHQLSNNQSLAIGGLIRIDFKKCDKVCTSSYFSNQLKIHRCKIKDADDLWENHQGELLKPTIDCSYFNNKQTINYKPYKIDIVIVGLGWISISGKYQNIEISGADKVQIIVREAMI